jgi:hypothetical protein
MAYNPIHDYRAKDALPSGSDQKVIRGADLSDEFEAIQGEIEKILANPAPSMLASCKWGNPNGQEGMTFGVGISDIQRSGDKFKIIFNNSFANHQYSCVITPQVATGSASPVFGWVVDQMAEYCTIQINEWNGSQLVVPSAAAFTCIIVDDDPINLG